MCSLYGDYGLKLVTAPTATPISVTQAKLHRRVDSSTDDSYFAGLIAMAVNWVEHHTGLQLCTATWCLYLDDFYPTGSPEVLLPKHPVQSVNSVKYVSADGVLTTLATDQYQLFTARKPAVLSPAYAVCWPAHRVQREAVQIEYVAGFGAAGDVPDRLKEAIRHLVGHFYEIREPVIIGQQPVEVPMGLQQILLNAWDGI